MNEDKHEIETKGLPSASSADVWLNCPGSIELNKRFPFEGNEHTERGTQLHSFMEHWNNGNDSAFDDCTDDERELLEFAAKATESLIEEVFGDVTDNLNSWTEIRMWLKHKGSYLCSGKMDLVVSQGNKHLIIDYKFGKVPVIDAADSGQLRVCAAALWSKIKDENATIVVAMIQPDPFFGKTVSKASYDKENIYQSIDAITNALTTPTPIFWTGLHCAKCNAAPHCPKRGACDEALKTLEPATLMPDRLFDYIEQCKIAAKLIEKRKSEAEEILLELVESGLLGGYEITQRTTKSIKDVMKARQALIEHFTSGEIIECITSLSIPKLVDAFLNKMEVPKGRKGSAKQEARRFVEELLSDVIIETQGKKTLKKVIQ